MFLCLHTLTTKGCVFFLTPVDMGEGLLLLFYSCSVMSNSLQPHGLQHASLPYPSLSPRVCLFRVHRVSDAIQPSHPVLSPSPAFSVSQHQGLFQ